MKDANVKVKEEPSIAATLSPAEPHVGAGGQPSEPQKNLTSPPLSSTIPTADASSPSMTTPVPVPVPASDATTNTPKEPAAQQQTPPTPSTERTSALQSQLLVPPPKESKSKSDSIAIAEYYDKFYRLWSERSGTSEILDLKESVNAAGAAFDTASAAVTTNRRDLDDALRKWERASGLHIQLLQRRESWTPEDAQRFADFVSLEITSKAELEQARHDLGRSEELLTKSQLDYINKMRRRYHEEQIWQDQWRVLGTYGTWTLICLNSCVFLGSQFFQRRRERDRTETIERWIRESKTDRGRTEAEAVEADRGASEMPASALAVEDTVNKNDVAEGVENNTIGKNEEELKTAESSEIERNDRVKPEDLAKSSQEEGHESNHRLHPAMERIGTTVASVGSFVNRWEHKVRSSTKDLAGSLNQKLRQALPTNIANEMPKSISEIHVPSAVIGASVGGIAALTISIILSAFSNRRY